MIQAREGCAHRHLPPGWAVRLGRWRSRPISRVLSWTVIPLGDASPRRSSNLPGPDAGNVIRSLFGLAPGGVCRAGLLPGSRCALTAPFHPCLIPRSEETRSIGGIFLLHFPSARAAQALPGTVPCGARTFLGTPEGMTRLPGRLRRGHFTAFAGKFPPKFVDANLGPHSLPLQTPSAAAASPLPRGILANGSLGRIPGKPNNRKRLPPRPSSRPLCGMSAVAAYI